MNYSKKQIEKSVYEFTVTIPRTEIQKSFEELLKNEIENIKVEGFRQGKAPKHLAEKEINKDKIYQNVINSILPKIYRDLIRKEELKPITNPNIKLIKAKENEDWVISIKITLKPDINVPNYREIVQKIKKEFKSKEIWVPGKDEKKDEKKKQQNSTVLLNKILNGLLNSAKIEIPKSIVETELNKKMAGLIDETQKAGLTLETYFQAKQTTLEAHKTKLTKEIIDMLSLEFMLDEIAEKEKITVTKEDLDAFLSTIKDKNKLGEMKKNAYAYAMLLRRQKLLDFLIGL